MKTCSKCDQEKPLNQYNKQSKTKDGLYSQCKDCARESNKKSYFRTSGKRNQYLIARRRRLAKERNEKIKTIKIACKQCGFDHFAALDFHHIDPKQKTMDIMYLKWSGCSDKTFWDEVAKCEVLCSNCHRILHWEERNKLQSGGIM